MLRAFPIEAVEAGFIAAEIKRLVAFAGGLLTYNDFVVLLRFNALSRAIESALRKEGIPSRVLAGHKFFERMEVYSLLRGAVRELTIDWVYRSRTCSRTFSSSITQLLFQRSPAL